MKLVKSVIVSYYINIIQSALNLPVTKGYFIRDSRINKPRSLLNPVILFGILLMILKYLLKQSEVVVKTYSVSGDSQSSH